MKKDKRTNYDLKNSTQKIERTPLKTGVNSCASGYKGNVEDTKGTTIEAVKLRRTDIQYSGQKKRNSTKHYTNTGLTKGMCSERVSM